MRLSVNGEPGEFSDGISVAHLLAELGLQERRIAVEINRAILPPDQYSARRLVAGDEVEIVHFVGGG